MAPLRAGSTAPAWIGSSSGHECFQGAIDDLRIYAAALSTEEIRQLYRDGLAALERSRRLPDDSALPLHRRPLACWTFDALDRGGLVAAASGKAQHAISITRLCGASAAYTATHCCSATNTSFFAMTRGHTYVCCMPPTNAFVAARCDRDGNNIYLTSANNEPDYLPSVLNDGRIIYTRWEYTGKPVWRAQGLWTVNPDGTQVNTFRGNQSVWPDLLKDARADDPPLVCQPVGRNMLQR